MTRPAVTVVMPFAGDADAARAALDALGSLEVRAGDELLLIDNAGTGVGGPGGGSEVRVLSARDERSAAHARNVGAAAASADWILFLDADCRPPAGLLDAYFAEPIALDVGALAGEVVPATGGRGLASRYAAARSFLGQESHLAHPYRPRAAAANLLVRREAFEQLGGFFEGVRAGEDTDFTWRLQQLGWRLELRAEAWVAHVYRSSLGELRRQWRGYAAGRAWLARRYPDFHPRPALVRALRGGGRRGAPAAGTGAASQAHSERRWGRTPVRSRRGRVAFLALDGLLAFEELLGFTLSNRPEPARTASRPPARVVLLADSFPAPDDPLVEFASALEAPRVQALRRPDRIDRQAVRRLRVEYLEDDGTAARAAARARLVVRRPLRCALDLAWRRRGQAPLRVLAPAVRRLEQEPAARLLTLGDSGPRSPGGRIARLAGRRVSDAG
jgi:GT2 family glycosyltransferase